jgi:hypothetical protein
MLQEKPSAFEREHPALQNMIFSIVVGHFCPPGSGSSNTNPCRSGSETLLIEHFLVVSINLLGYDYYPLSRSGIN